MGEYEVGKRNTGEKTDRNNHEGHNIKWGRIVKREQADDASKWDRVFKRDAEAESKEFSEMVACRAEEREEDDN